MSRTLDSNICTDISEETLLSNSQSHRVGQSQSHSCTCSTHPHVPTHVHHKTTTRPCPYSPHSPAHSLHSPTHNHTAQRHPPTHYTALPTLTTLLHTPLTGYSGLVGVVWADQHSNHLNTTETDNVHTYVRTYTCTYIHNLELHLQHRLR